jgi:hypothetical protein
MPRHAREAVDEDQLLATIRELSQEVRVLREAVDELREELQWSNRNPLPHNPPSSRFVLTSMPLDPAAEDWEINRLTANDLPEEHSQNAPRSQTSLF